MHASSRLVRTALLIVATVPAVGFAAGDTFRNGQSLHGQPATASSTTRVVDLTQTTRPNIAYGETVVFRNATGQQFAWTFSGLDRRGVDLAKIAPAGFATQDTIADVGRNPANRR
ncbi:MAG: CzcE family metal-binding protein [Sphaerotilus natans]|jgi:hypothetical protein|uniref:CzcE family metal-binding protein n=1 Tax=Sphaerotilus TaxID=34102 RepID=UPI0020416822|nr:MULTISPECIES: CzcE family metal-binding protein [Sphaerotilus]MCK6400899.1 CzcE family metal-binding protein [Sphaerotilus sulfidivorans]GKQ59663.1 hypothetical protein QMTAC487_35240 [Sphaerotilus sp. FB-3]